MDSFLSNVKQLPRVQLAHLPTPVEELRSLSRAVNGPHILIKRDDQTGLALGGNKTRKLEFLLADALQGSATAIVTAGSAQSNHCRQTAAAATRLGLECHLVLGGETPGHPTGNLLLDHLLGATVHWTGMERRGERMDEVAAELRAAGKRPYIIPYGGSNAVGATGYAFAMMELTDQLGRLGQNVDHIVVASSSGGTQAGLAVGARVSRFGGTLLGISIDKHERGLLPFEEELAALSNETAGRIGFDTTFRREDFTVNYGYLGDGYGVVGDLEREAIKLLARSEAILLDPVYTGRAMGALIDLIRRQEFDKDKTVLFWHTGGAPALFAYEPDLGLRGTEFK